MTDINIVTIIGRITRDIGADEKSFAYGSTGLARAKVSIAVNRSFKSAEQQVEEVSFFDVIIWGKQAETLKPYLIKGKQICVTGYLKQNRWEKDGQKFSKIDIVANSVQLLGSPRAQGEGSSYSQNTPGYSQGGSSYSAPQQSPHPLAPVKAAQPSTNYDPEPPSYTEDIPF